MFDEMIAAWRKRRAQDRAIAELKTLDRHALNDLGISRDQIPAFVRGRLTRP